MINESSKIWPAPAKINLFLHVVGKRPDGYHELQTVFQFLDFSDELHFRLNDHGQVKRDYDYGFDESTDLCLRAAHLVKSHAQEHCGVTISLSKKLPMGGGLGGGSSDAATVLIALNQLWNVGLSRAELAELGLQLGADVPVFVQGQAAWAEGVGERLTPLDLDEKWFLVINPNICVSTAKVFAHKHLTARPQMMKIRAFQEADQVHFGDNQLEPIVRAEYPEVDRLFRWLQAFGEPRMSGSGGAVFLPLEGRQQGLEILEKRPSRTTGFVAKGVNLHPLYRL
ncbi:MAG: 4-(cytidine 5'-diphospho)-2-C-methyl-D-erythritol kinase [Pseudomonadota bacterium]